MDTRDYSMYGYFKGEKDNPFEAQTEVLSTRLPGYCGNYLADPVVRKGEERQCQSCRLYPCNVDANLHNAKIFWDYERMFEDKFDQGNFSVGFWGAEHNAELKAALNHPNKADIFKMWLSGLLGYLADKYETDIDHFNGLYRGNIMG